MLFALTLSCGVLSCLSAAIDSDAAHSSPVRRQTLGISSHGTLSLDDGSLKTLDDDHLKLGAAEIVRGELSHDLLEPGVLVHQEEKKARTDEKIREGASTLLGRVKEASSIGPIIGQLIQLVIFLVFAYLYNKNIIIGIPTMQQKPLSEEKEFPNGLFDCFSNTHLCLHVTCCTPIRMAHNWSVTGFMDFWTAVLLQVLCPCVMPCIGGCMWRPKVRAVLGLQEDTMMDFIKYCCCCMCCAIGQEALKIDEECGVAVECCLTKTGGAATPLAEPLQTNNAEPPAATPTNAAETTAADATEEAP
jgi:Cys-rich protein (TIGR01571 family)